MFYIHLDLYKVDYQLHRLALNSRLQSVVVATDTKSCIQ